MAGAVLFDLFETLVPSSPREVRLREYERMAVDVGAEPEVFARLYSATARERFVGALGDASATVRTIAARAGVNPTDSQVGLAVARRVASARRLLWPPPGTLDVLDALRAAGWRLGLVSNCTGEVPGLWKRTPFASRFDTVAFSCVVGAAKPDPAIFLAAVAGLGLSPNECRYVGDGRDDELAAAAGLGMAPIRMVGFRHDDAAWPRERISSLPELLPLLGL